MRRFAALALVGAALSAHASVTNVVDVAALAAAADAGLSETNGWTLLGLSTYDKNCVKFDTKGDWLLSPDFGARIVLIEASVRCSSTNPTRRVYFCPKNESSVLTNFVACARGDSLEAQTLAFPSDSSVSCVKLKLDGSGNTGVWGVKELRIVVDFDAPTDLCVARMGYDWCDLAWENGENTVSNRIDAYQIEHGAGEERLLATGFDNFSAIGKGNPVSCVDMLSKIDPGLSGVNIYAPTNTSGICQVGKRDALGIIRWSGSRDHADELLRMVAKHYPSDNPGTIVAYETEGATNAIAALTLTDEFCEYTVDLSKDSSGNDVPGDSAILIGYYDTSKSKHRVLIDSLSIVRTNADRRTLVGTNWIPASHGTASFSTRDVFDLPTRAECRFEVLAASSDWLFSGASILETKLGGIPGARLILR